MSCRQSCQVVVSNEHVLDCFAITNGPCHRPEAGLACRCAGSHCTHMSATD
jgi:hypothetical protein